MKYSVEGNNKGFKISISENKDLYLYRYIIRGHTSSNKGTISFWIHLYDYFLDVNNPTEEELIMFELDTNLDIIGIRKSVVEYCDKHSQEPLRWCV